MSEKYEIYRTTSEKWLKDIPEHWQTQTIKSVVCERKEKNSPVKTNDILSLTAKQGVIPYNEKKSGGNKAKEDISLYNLAYENDLLVNCMNVVSGSSGISRYYGAISPVYYAFFARNNSINISYLEYIFRLPTFYQTLVGFGNGILMKKSSSGKLNTVRKRIPMNKLNKVIVPIPPRNEQDQIVRFLNWETGQINRFIKEKLRQIRLLEEYKLATINRMVTKGLNHNLRMKESDVQWIGSMPIHWKADKIKQHFKIKKKIAGKEGYDVLSITQKGIVIKDISSNEGQMAQTYENYQIVCPSDFAMNHMDLITGFVDCSPFYGVTSPDYRVFTLEDKENCFDQYYLKVFQVCYKRRIFYAFGRGAASQGRWRLPKMEFLNFMIPVPSLEEQKEIAEACLAVEAQIKQMTDALREEIGLITEYRTRLISDVITGKIDVRKIEIPEYENDRGLEATIDIYDENELDQIEEEMEVDVDDIN